MRAAPRPARSSLLHARVAAPVAVAEQEAHVRAGARRGSQGASRAARKGRPGRRGRSRNRSAAAPQRAIDGRSRPPVAQLLGPSSPYRPGRPPQVRSLPRSAAGRPERHRPAGWWRPRSLPGAHRWGPAAGWVRRGHQQSERPVPNLLQARELDKVLPGVGGDAGHRPGRDASCCQLVTASFKRPACRRELSFSGDGAAGCGLGRLEQPRQHHPVRRLGVGERLGQGHQRVQVPRGRRPRGGLRRTRPGAA
jgi:hypothetical protein